MVNANAQLQLCFFEVLSREFTDASGATHVEQDSGSGSDNVSIVSLLRELLALAMCIGIFW